MALGGNVGICVAGAAFATGMGGIALLGTGRFLLCGFVIMPRSRDLVGGIDISAFATGMGGTATLSTGSLCGRSGIAVAGGRGGFRIAVSAFSTGEGFDTVHSAGRGDVFAALIAVIRGGDFISNEFILASGTGIGGIARFGAGGG